MKKMCPRCGVIFEVTTDPVFCSEKCKMIFHESGLDYIKGRPRGGSLHSDNYEIIKPKKKES